MSLKKWMASAAALTMAASPCAAAQPSHMQDVPRADAFVGAYLRLPLDRGAGRRTGPQIGLRMSALHDYRSAQDQTAANRHSDVADLRLTGMSQPTLLIGGRPMTGGNAVRLNALGTGETIALVGGGVVLLLLVGLAAGGGAGLGDTCPTIEGRRDHCINP